jgi:hypothetical protein
MDSDALKDRGVTILVMLQCYIRYSTSDLCPFSSSGLCSAGLFPIYFLYLQDRKFEFRNTPMTWQDLFEYYEYLSRAVSIKLIESKDHTAEQIRLLSLSFMQSEMQIKYIFM